MGPETDFFGLKEAARYSGSLESETIKTFTLFTCTWLVSKTLNIAQNRPALLPEGPWLSHPKPCVGFRSRRKILEGHGRVGVGSAGP